MAIHRSCCLEMREEVKERIIKTLAQNRQLEGEVSVTPVRGGDISEGYIFCIGRHKFFLKTYGELTPPEDFYPSEVDGLDTLRLNTHLHIPEIIASDTDFILQEYIKEAAPAFDYSACLADGLAALHKSTDTHFGWVRNNFIGSLPQINNPAETWPEFYCSYRLEPLLQMARDKSAFNAAETRYISKIFGEIHRIMPAEKPALLHGDLWCGNAMSDHLGQPVLIDPSVYYGHREMDLAMAFLFGGFTKDFYRIYNEIFPLESGWQKRMGCAQLYPLLVHTVLFGGNYPKRVMDEVRYFMG